MPQIISFEKALRLLFENLPESKRETVPLAAALGRIAAREVKADQEVPLFDKAVMDGYALRSKDVSPAPFSLELVGEIPAGEVNPGTVGPMETSAIMTGAPLPGGADTVVMIEKTERGPGSEILFHTTPVAGEYVAPKGSEVSIGQTVLRVGEFISPTQIAVLGTFGQEQVEVFAIPGLAVLPTGSEIVEVGQVPAYGQIRNSNAPMLAAQGKRLGVECEVLPVVPDNPDATRAAMEMALKRAEVVVLTGGVSMGEHDYVPRVLREMGVKIIFHKVAMKPGKPVLFGRIDQQLVFGLPGNPVSSYVTFEMLVRPALKRCMGQPNGALPSVFARLQGSVKAAAGRVFFAPGRIEMSEYGVDVAPIRTRGSADMTAFAPADGLIEVPADAGLLEAGATVKVWILERFFAAGGTDEAYPRG